MSVSSSLLWFRSLSALFLLSVLFPADGNAQNTKPSISLSCSPTLIVAGETVTITATISPSTETPDSNLTVSVNNIGYGITHTNPVIAAGSSSGTGTVSNTGGATGRYISVGFAAPSGYRHGGGCSFTVAGGGGGDPPDPEEALSFSRTSVIVKEGKSASYTVSLATQPSGTVTVAVSRSSGDSDLTLDKSSLIFTTSNWSTGQTVTVSAAQDDDIADGTATISHSASGGGYGSVTGNVTAREDDDDTPALSFSRTSLTVPEGGEASYSVSLAYEPTATVTVAVRRSSGDSSLTVNKSSLTFTASNWDSAQEVTVSAGEDADGIDGTATFAHTASGGGYGSVTGNVTATEADNDRSISVSRASLTVAEGSSATWSVSLATRPSATVTVAVSRSSGDSDLTVNKSSLTFTTSNWSAGQTVRVSAAQDTDIANDTATFTHTASGGGYGGITRDVTATEDDDDSPALSFSRTSLTVPEGGEASYSVSLAYEPTATVTVTLSKTGDSDLAVNKSSLTFTTSNWNAPQPVTVSAAEDDDGLDGAATIAHSASGGGYGSVTGDVTATEDDNDTAGLAFSSTSFSVPEGGEAQYSVSLATEPSATVTVAVSRASGDANLSIDKSSLTFTAANWKTGQEITVSAAEDTDGLNGEATIRHSASGGDYGGITADVTAIESDNDTAGLSLSDTALSVPEGGTAKYSLTLATEPTATVTVAIARSSGDSDLTVDTSSLTFTTANWYVAQQVTVSAAQDDDIADGEATFTHTASGGDYAGITATVAATEEDSDSAALTLSRRSLPVAEGSSAEYTLSLAHEPTASVTVAIARSSGDSDLAVSPASLTFTTADWDTAQEVTVSAAEDDDIADGAATFTHSASGGGYDGIASEVRATEQDNDTPALSFTSTSVSVHEGGEATYSVSLAYRPASTVAVLLTRASGDRDLSVTPPALTFTPSNWNQAQQVTLSAGEDPDLINGTATIRHSALGGGYDSVTADVTATEKDNDAAGLVLSSASVRVPEGGTASYSVSLAYEPTGPVTLALSITGDSDLAVSEESLTFSPSGWDTPREVTVSAAEDDDIADGEATVSHSASGGGYGGVTASITATEEDNDSPSLTFTPALIPVPEGGEATYSVSLAYAPTGPVTLMLAVSGDADLSVNPASLTFTVSNWDSAQQVTVSAAEDDDIDPGRAIISHAASGGGYGGTTESITAVEQDNDIPALVLSATSVSVPEGGEATYSVSLAYQPVAAVTVLLSRASGDTDLSVSPMILSFSPIDWNAAQEVTVAATEDTDAANGEAVIAHSALGGGYDSVTGEVTATEVDNDTAGLVFSRTSFFVPEGQSASYTVSLATRPTGSVTVKLSVSGDEDLSVSPETLTFTPADWTGGQEVTVSAAEDTDATNGEATITHTASGGGYEGVTADATATESDNDAPGLTLSEIEFPVPEGASATYTVSLASRPGATVTVAVSRASGDEDLTASPASLTFTTANWNTAQEVTVSAAEDEDGANGQATFLHTASGADYGGVTAEAIATEVDNDTAGIILSEASLTIDEAGGSGAYTVELATIPSGPVRVTVASRDPTVATASPTSLTFTAADWNQPKRVTVTAVDDFIDSDRSTRITHRSSGGDYGDLEGPALEVILRDDDTAGVRLDPEEISLGEGAQGSYTLQLLSEPRSPVVIAISRIGENVDNLGWDPKRLTFSAIDWNRPQTITLEVAPDEDTTPAVALLRHSADSLDPAYNRIGIDDFEVIVEDDDELPTSATLTLSREELAEGDPSTLVSVTATLDAVTTVDLSITLVLGGTATGEDYSVGGVQVIEIKANEQEGETVLTFTPVDDALVEETETIEITGASPALLVRGAAMTLLDNDQQVGSAALSLSDDEIAEGDTAALVTVTATLDAVTSAGVTIVLSLGGTASAEDYDVGGDLSLTIDPGEDTGQTVLTFVPVDDALVEGTETIIVNGSSPGLDIPQATLNLIDDDTAIGEAVGDLSVDPERVAESARDTLVTVTLTLREGFAFDELRTFTVTLAGSGEEAAVDFEPVQPLSITLLSGSSQGQATFLLSLENDLIDEIDETLTLSVVDSPLPVNPAAITLVDDDAPPGGIALSLDDPDIAEGDPPTDITVTARVEGVTTYAYPVTLTLAFGGTATQGEEGDYIVSGELSLSIPAGEQMASTVLTFAAIDDTRDELDETIEIGGRTPGGVSAAPTFLTLLDNDESPLTLEAEPSRLDEGGGPVPVTVTVALRSGAPYGEDLSVALEFGGTAVRDGDYTVAGPLRVLIPAGGLSASTTLSLAPVDDTLDEPDETIEIIGNSGAGYTGTAVVLIIDNDIPPARIHLTASPASLLETDPPTRVLLEARVEGDTAFSADPEIVLALEGTAVATVDYDLGGLADPLIIPAGQLSAARELNLTPIDDPHPEGAERILIAGTSIVRVIEAGITLLDDDGADLTISFTRAEYTANEYGAGAAVTVTVTPAADRREVVDLAFSHLGGITPDDYRGLPEELVFEPGDEAFSFTVEALPDEAYESGERIRLRLASLSPQVSFQPLATATVLLVEQRSAEEFSRQTRTVLALSSRAWSDSVQSALEERFARSRQTGQWGGWQPGYQEPPAPAGSDRNAIAPRGPPASAAEPIIPGDWLAAWRQKKERRNMGLIEPRLSLRKVLTKLKGWRPVVWAEGSTHHFSGALDSLDYRGGFQAAHLGLDLHSGKKTLIGASVMGGRSTMDYSNGQGLDGSTTATLYTIHPYLHFQAHDRVTVWTIGGLGLAPLNFEELDRDHDLSGAARMAAAGVRIRAKDWEGRELAIRGDGDIAWIGARLPAESVTLGGHAGRVRLLAELTQSFRLFGQDLVATGEVGARLDRGGGHRGGGAEAGGRLSWRKPEKGLDLSVHGTSLLWHQSPFRIWGGGIQAGWDPGAEKRGLVLRFAAGRGPRGGKIRLFQESIDHFIQPADILDSEIDLGYGTGFGIRLLTLTFRLRDFTGWTIALDMR